MGDAASSAGLLRADLAIEYPFNRTTGPVIGAFFTGLREGVVVGIKGADGRVICPPVEYDPVTSEPLTEIVPVGDQGVVTTWSWVATPRATEALQEPHALALIQLDGADTAMLHVVKAPGPDAMSIGARVAAHWADERSGAVTDIAYFELAGAGEGN